MMEYSLEEDIPEEFKGGTLSIYSEEAKTPHKESTNSNNIINKSQSTDNNADSSTVSNNNVNTVWGTSMITGIPQRICETVFPKRDSSEDKKDRTVQISTAAVENPNDYFTFRDGIVDKAIEECVEQFLDQEVDGPLLASFLLTQITPWNTDKERLLLITPKVLVNVKYDFIALKRLEYKKVPLEMIDTIIIGDLVYPSASLVPHINGLAEGVSNVVQNYCLFQRWSNNNDNAVSALFQARSRNIRGIRLMWNKGKPIEFSKKWNPFKSDIPYFTFSFHPLYFNKDCPNEKQRILYDLEEFADKICSVIVDLQRIKNNSTESCLIHHKDILLENYFSIGSVIHNNNALGFFKVRGKFSF